MTAPVTVTAPVTAPVAVAAPVIATAPVSKPVAAVPFPPPAFKPLYERTAKPDDGVWTAVSDGTGRERPALAKTVVHPHPIQGFTYVTIVAIDLRQIELHLVAGTLEPKSDAVPAERRPGLIPATDHDKLLVVFNGGFMARHGRFGMMIDGDTFLPPKPEACTVALQKDRSIQIRTFTELAPVLNETAAYRQTPPCILERGVPHPELGSEQKPRKWGAAEDGKTEIRRSALGIDASGTILFYGLGEDTTVKVLADAMKAAGAHDAAQLDINWSYTRFLFFGRPSPSVPPEVISTLIPKIKHTKKGYVTNASERDFFYLTLIASPAAQSAPH